MDATWKLAIGEGDAGVARQLLHRGADIDARDRYGQTALTLAGKTARDLAAERGMQKLCAELEPRA